MTRCHRFLLASLAILLLAGTASADHCYVVIFGAQSRPQRPKYSHSWATFVRIPGPPCGPPAPDSGSAEIFTISWLPTEIELHPNRLLPEPGMNVDLRSSFQIALSQCEEMSAWGPLEIQPKLFCLAARHAQRLASGEVQYKTIDFAHNPKRVSNCIHALTVFNTEKLRPRIGRTNFGEIASYYVARNYEDWYICPSQVHCWIADLLGLGEYPIKWRRLEDGRPRPRRE
jgi:hypothetical protein